MNTVKNFTAIHLQLSDKVCVSNKTEYLNLSMFNMTTEINESKILTTI